MWYLCSHISRAEYHDHNITNVGRKWEFISHKKHFSWFLENIWEGIFGEANKHHPEQYGLKFILSEQYFRLFELLMANKQSVESTLSKVKKHHCSLSYRFQKNNKTWLHCLHSCQLPRDMMRNTAPMILVPVSRLMQQQHASSRLQCDILEPPAPESALSGIFSIILSHWWCLSLYSSVRRIFFTAAAGSMRHILPSAELWHRVTVSQSQWQSEGLSVITKHQPLHIVWRRLYSEEKDTVGYSVVDFIGTLG